MKSSQASVTSMLFVCMGNICRSPAGENVMRKLLEDAGLADSVKLDSAGTHGYHIGHPPDSRMIQAGRKRGLPMTGAARKVTRQDIETFDLILAMGEDNYQELIRLSTEDNRHKVKRFISYCIRHKDDEVPDPYYGEMSDFEYVLDLLEDGCSEILKEIRSDDGSRGRQNEA
jgi:protein-tyrosine phosphatase